MSKVKQEKLNLELAEKEKQTRAKDTRNYEEMLMDCITDMFNPKKGE